MYFAYMYMYVQQNARKIAWPRWTCSRYVVMWSLEYAARMSRGFIKQSNSRTPLDDKPVCLLFANVISILCRQLRAWREWSGQQWWLEPLQKWRRKPQQRARRYGLLIYTIRLNFKCFISLAYRPRRRAMRGSCCTFQDLLTSPLLQGYPGRVQGFSCSQVKQRMVCKLSKSLMVFAYIFTHILP